MSIHAFLNSKQLKDSLPTQRFVITLPESSKNTMNTRASSKKTSKRRGVALLIQGGATCPKLMQQVAIHPVRVSTQTKSNYCPNAKLEVRMCVALTFKAFKAPPRIQHHI